MKRSQSSGFWATFAVSAAVAALAVLVGFGARPTNAGRPQKKHAAVARTVAVDGTLVKEGAGWSIRVKAENSGNEEQRCDLGTRLTSVRNSMMARVPPTPRVIWETTLALSVPAKGEADQALAVPEEVAKRLNAAQAPKKDELTTESFGVRIEASCEKAPRELS